MNDINIDEKNIMLMCLKRHIINYTYCYKLLIVFFFSFKRTFQCLFFCDITLVVKSNCILIDNIETPSEKFSSQRL